MSHSPSDAIQIALHNYLLIQTLCANVNLLHGKGIKSPKFTSDKNEEYHLYFDSISFSDLDINKRLLSCAESALVHLVIITHTAFFDAKYKKLVKIKNKNDLHFFTLLSALRNSFAHSDTYDVRWKIRDKFYQNKFEFSYIKSGNKVWVKADLSRKNGQKMDMPLVDILTIISYAQELLLHTSTIKKST